MDLFVICKLGLGNGVALIPFDSDTFNILLNVYEIR